MRKTLQTIFLPLLALVFFGAVNLQAQTEAQMKEKFRHAMTQDRNSSGRDFYCAFPMNDNKDATTQTIAIYITSSVNTTATIRNDALGLNITKQVKALEITEFSSVRGGLGWDSEIKNYETIEDQGLHITSPDPISVYAMNSKYVTSEGYLAIPTNYWGTDYIHNSFFDYKEQPNVDWGGGFVVLAKEDFTRVRIQIVDGFNKVRGFGQTLGGRKHGDRIDVTLMAGQTYAVQGDGKTRGVFDLSGSLIGADKPIGLLSYHNRCMIPSTVVDNGRDHLIEMPPPVSAWGKEYATVEYARGKDKGDYFRVVAGADNVTFSINWYEKAGGGNNTPIGLIGPIKLQKKGDWFEYNNTGAKAPHDIESIRGVSKFKADGPIQVMQYAYAANYDNASNYDPFMILVTPVEQYTKETVFQTPANYAQNEFRDNYFNIIAIGDTTDPVRHQELIRSITIDGVPISNLVPAFSGNRIPGTNLYWAFISKLAQGTHKLKGETPFGGYIYGFATNDSYGWPAATAFGNLAEIDTLAPIVTFPPACFEWLVTNEDDPENKRNGKEGDNPKQVDVGVRSMPELLPGSFNFDEPVYVDENGNPAVFSGREPNYKFDYKIKVTNPFENAKAILRVKDDVGNTTDTTIIYSVDKITSTPDPIVFGKVLVNSTTNTIDVKITSASDIPVTISEIKLRVNKVYKITTDLSFLPYVIQPGKDTTITVSYTPIKEYVDISPKPELQFDFDTLAVKTGCLDWEFALNGQGVKPQIKVTDYNAGLAQVGQVTLSNNNTINSGVFITNEGTKNLTVTGLRLVKPPFNLPNMPAANVIGDVITFDTPITVPFGGILTQVNFGHLLNTKYLIRFAPTSTNPADNSIDVTFISDASPDASNDSISRWFGSALQSGPNVVGDGFPDTRVEGQSAVTRYALITNELPQDQGPETGTVILVNINTIKLEKNDGNFILHPTEKIQGFNDQGDLIRPDLSTATTEQLYVAGTTNSAGKVTTIKVPVLFTPKFEGDLFDNVVVEFNAEKDKKLSGRVFGAGFLPEVNVTNQTFSPNLVNQGVHPTPGEIIITNTTTPVDNERSHLIIKSIELDNTSPNGNLFTNFTLSSTGQPIDQITDLRLEKDESIIINYDFSTNSPTTGDVVARLKVLTDAGPAISLQDPVTDNDYKFDFDGNYFIDSLVNPIPYNDGGYIVGFLYADGVRAEGYDWGAISACNVTDQEITIYNTAQNENASAQVIKSIDYVGTDPNKDKYTFFGNYIGVSVPVGGNVKVGVRFKTNPPEGDYRRAEYVVRFEQVDTVAAKAAPFFMDGQIVRDEFEVELKKFPNIRPGDVMNMDVTIKSINSNYTTAEIGELSVTLRYKPEWLAYQGDNGNGDLINWLTITDTKQNVIIGGQNWVDHTFILKAPGNQKLTKDGILFSPQFMYLLHENIIDGVDNSKISIVPELEAVSFTGRNDCVDGIPIDGLITSQFCVQKYRALGDLFIGDAGPIAPVSPNPVHGNMNLNFTVGSAADVTLEITNLNGELVKVLMQAPLAAGQYETTANVSDLPSGAYFLTYKYLGVNETQKIVIAK